MIKPNLVVLRAALFASLWTGVAPAQSEIYYFSTIAGQAGTTGLVDGTNNGALFDAPFGVTTDISGNLYVVDAGTSAIRQVIPQGTNWVTTTIAGGKLGYSDTTNRSALFWNPHGIVVDSEGTLYIADSGNNALRSLTLEGTNWVASTLAGGGGVGDSDGTNRNARLAYPCGVAVDNVGNVYFADTENDKIREASPMGTNWVVISLAGSDNAGVADGTNTTAQFRQPEGVAVGNNSDVFVADTGNSTIRRITPSGTNWVVTTIAGSALQPGIADGSNSTARFHAPVSLCVDTNGNIYVADQGGDTIRKMVPVGTNWVVTTIGGRPGYLGSSNGTNSAARFYQPSGVTLDAAGRLYIGDSGNDTVRQGIEIAPPVFQMVSEVDGQILFSWNAMVNQLYQLAYTTDLAQTNWTALGTPITATNTTMYSSDPLPLDNQRFYRAMLQLGSP